MSSPDRRPAPAAGASQPFQPDGAVAVVTGAAGGIGAALVRELAARGASTVVAADLDLSLIHI